MKEKKSFKLNNILLSLFAILAIFFIVWITTYSTTRNTVAQSNGDLTGQATQVAYSEDNSNLAFCKLIVGETILPDGNQLTASLSAGESAYYSGHTITVKEITSDSCVIGVDEGFDYIALGQIQKFNSLYITVKDIVN